MGGNQPFIEKNEDLQYRYDLKKNLSNVLRPTKTRTVKFTTSMTMTQIQERIDALHKYIPIGSTLTLQFDDGTYTVSTGLLFQGFYGGGILKVFGNTSDSTSLSTAQSVYLDGNALDDDVLTFSNCKVQIQIWHLKIRAKTSSANRSCIYMVNCNKAEVFYNYFLGNSTSYGYLFESQYSNPRVAVCYFSNSSSAIWSYLGSVITARNNADTGTMPKYGQVGYEGIIMESGTFVDGSTSDDYEARGGRVFT